MTDRLILSITQLNAEVSQLLTHGLPPLWIEGEISNLSRPSSGHLYFTLKDEQAQLRCALFRNKAMTLAIQPSNGLKVWVYGRVGLYESRGDYQFIAERMEAAGEGELQRRFDALKRQLQAAGLFAPEHKRPLPAFPRQIGVITSPTGAAIRDILHVLNRRCPQIPVLVYPVAVQGEQAAGQLVRALQQANREPVCDVLILARGGGSLEDLWPFNEESVAHAIHASHIPVISGVGHEIDFTIADFVADLRAPTPSAAAELASPDSRALQERLQQLQRQLKLHTQRYLMQQQQRLHALQQGLTRQHPANRLQQKAQRLDELELRLQRALHQRLTRQQERLRLHAARLHAFSPLATLERGYALVLTPDQQLLKRAQQVTVGQTIQVRLADGELACRVESKA